MKSYKSKRRHEVNEAESSLPAKVVEKLGKQAELAGGDFWKQLIGSSISSESSKEGTVFELSKLKKSEQEGSVRSREKKAKAEIQPGIEYHREYYESIAKFGERAVHHETIQESRKIQQIMAELKRLVTTTKSLQVEFGLVSVQDAPVNTGKYYLNFFEWMLIMLKQARQKVEDSKSWLETVKGKKKKKSGYWAKSKKFGTSFSQANERFVATSTG